MRLALHRTTITLLTGWLVSVLLLSSTSITRAANFTQNTSISWPAVNSSVAWGDWNNDGYPDLFSETTLYTNNQTGSFSPTTPYGEIGYLSLGDYDNDGWLDLLGVRDTGNGGQLMNLYRNDGGTGFVDDSAKFQVSSDHPWISMGNTWGDFNSDGYLDVYVSGWCRPWLGPPDDDVIYMSNEGNTFTENWKSSSVVSKAYGKGVTVVDFDRDADLDVYVSNYWLTANYLWRNDGFNGTTGMTRVGGSVANGGHTQGSTVGDFDNDGDFDIYVSNFAHGGNPSSVFMENQGAAGGYSFISRGLSGIGQLEPFAAATTADYDNDGYLDLFITTSGGYPQSGQTKLYRNNGDWTFSQVDYGLNNLGCCVQQGWADYDNDGFLDLATAGKLMRNPGTANWSNHDYLKVKLLGGQGENGLINQAAIGAQVSIDVPGLGKVTRQVEGNTGVEGMSNDQTLHFGLGNYSGSKVDLEIFWPDGTIENVTNVAINQLVEIQVYTAGPQEKICHFNADSVCNLADINKMYTETGYDLVNGVSASELEEYDLNSDEVVDSQDVDLWLELAAIENGYLSPYLRGDTYGLNSQFPATRDIGLMDYNVLISLFNPSGTNGPYLWQDGNFDGDGDIDLSDYNFLASNFRPTGYGPNQAVPEPTSIALGMLGLATLALAARRKRPSS